MYKTNSLEMAKSAMAPKINISHNPYAGPPRDDSYVVWKESDQNCRRRKIFEILLTN